MKMKREDVRNIAIIAHVAVKAERRIQSQSGGSGARHGLQ